MEDLRMLLVSSKEAGFGPRIANGRLRSASSLKLARSGVGQRSTKSKAARRRIDEKVSSGDRILADYGPFGTIEVNFT